LGDVARNPARAEPVVAEASGSALRPVGIDVQKDDVISGLSERDSRGSADAEGGTGDDGYGLPGQFQSPVST
jgi:hypothetical protein